MIAGNKTETKLSDTPQEVEFAARIFTQLKPSFETLVDGLSLKEARRLLKAVVIYPLQDDKQKLLAHPVEEPLFKQALDLIEAKAVMIEYAVKQKQLQEEQKAKVEEKSESN